MIKSEIRILNKLGLHARPASKLVKIISMSDSDVTLIKGGQRVNAKSILGVLLLQAECNSIVKLEINGPDETQLLQQINDLVSRKFGEE